MDRRPSFREAAELWAMIAGQSFGGPAGQIAVMHRLLVEERRWLGEERFLHSLNYCMLLPGPEAQQLVSYVGWLSHGLRGGWVAGWLFVLPGFVAILMLSSMYWRFQSVPAVEAGLLGLKAAVLAVVLEAMIRIGRRVSSSPPTVLVALAAFCALFFLEVPFPLVIAAAGLVGAALPAHFPPPAPPKAKLVGDERPLLDGLLDDGLLPHTEPSPRRDLAVGAGLLGLWLAPTLLLWVFAPGSTWTEVATFFSSAAVVTFGGAYSVLAYVAQQAVEVQGWLSAEEMLDGLGLAETTPGPLIQVVQFVGFLATARDPGPLDPQTAGFLGSILTTWVTFTPSFLFVLAGGPYVERVRRIAGLASALRAITSAVVGVIGNLTVWLTLHVWFEVVREEHYGPVRLLLPDLSTISWLSVAIALGAGVLLLWRKTPMMIVLALGTAAGLIGWVGELVLG